LVGSGNGIQSLLMQLFILLIVFKYSAIAVECLKQIMNVQCILRFFVKRGNFIKFKNFFLIPGKRRSNQRFGSIFKTDSAV